MIIRPITAADAEPLFHMMCLLDEETEFMLYEPGEREARTKDLSRLTEVIRAAVDGGDLLLAAVTEEDEIVGYIWAERGKLNRVRHTAYIVVGIRRAYRGQGIGTELFRRLDAWARESGVVRLELTVERMNIAARSLYEKAGFQVEGVRPGSMLVNERLTDEYYMGKLLR